MNLFVIVREEVADHVLQLRVNERSPDNHHGAVVRLVHEETGEFENRIGKRKMAFKILPFNQGRIAFIFVLHWCGPRGF